MISETALLFSSFFQIGLFSMGGGYAVIPLIRQEAVVVHGWITLQEFTDIIAISQMTPGPLAVNTSTFAGLRIGGAVGAATATLGCILPGFFISLLLYFFFTRFRHSPLATSILKHLRAASTGLIASAAATILCLVFSDVTTASPKAVIEPFLILAIALLLLRKYRTNPMLIMAGSAAVGMLSCLIPL